MFSRETAPEPGNRFRLRLRLRCVRACERAKLRARDDSSVAGVGRANLWGRRRPASTRMSLYEWLVRRCRILGLIASGYSTKRAECFRNRD